MGTGLVIYCRVDQLEASTPLTPADQVVMPFKPVHETIPAQAEENTGWNLIRAEYPGIRSLKIHVLLPVSPCVDEYMEETEGIPTEALHLSAARSPMGVSKTKPKLRSRTTKKLQENSS